jgi:hypothetical protein
MKLTRMCSEVCRDEKRIHCRLTTRQIEISVSVRSNHTCEAAYSGVFFGTGVSIIGFVMRRVWPALYDKEFLINSQYLLMIGMAGAIIDIKKLKTHDQKTRTHGVERFGYPTVARILS